MVNSIWRIFFKNQKTETICLCLLCFPKQGEQDDFRTFKWLYEIDNLSNALEESRYLLKI